MEMTDERLEEIRNEAIAEGHAKAVEELGRWRDVRDELPKEMTEAEIRQIREAVSLSGSLSDVYYRKQIGG